MNLTPIHLPQSVLLAIRGTKPDTFPAEPISAGLVPLGQVQIPIPRQIYDGDWIVESENDIKWLNDKAPALVGDGFWVRESHRYLFDGAKVICEYSDLEKREVPVEQSCIRWEGRKLAPVCMYRKAARYVLKVHKVDTVWADPKRTQLNWIMDVSRIGDVLSVL
jgi:hypothetical protein